MGKFDRGRILDPTKFPVVTEADLMVKVLADLIRKCLVESGVKMASLGLGFREKFPVENLSQRFSGLSRPGVIVGVVCI